MSVYLYAFGIKPRAAVLADVTVELFHLKFRRANAQDVGPISRIVDRVDAAWSGRDLGRIRYYVEGRIQAGALVWQVQEPVARPEWFDTDPMPGRAVVVGALVKRGRQWHVETRFEVVRETHKRSQLPSGNSILHLVDKPAVWPVTGAGFLPYAEAMAEAGRLRKLEPADTVYRFDVRPVGAV